MNNFHGAHVVGYLHAVEMIISIAIWTRYLNWLAAYLIIEWQSINYCQLHHLVCSLSANRSLNYISISLYLSILSRRRAVCNKYNALIYRTS